MKRWAFTWAFKASILVAVLMGLSACASSGSSATTSQAGAPVEAADSMIDSYKIGVDDQVQVNVWGNPDLSVSVPVRPDGMISMPLIGDVGAGGKTPEDVAADITDKLSYYIREPNVTVLVTQLRSHEYISRIRVTGAVQKPISIPFRQGMTVLDAVLEAGGVSEFASLGKTRLHRKHDGKQEVFDVPLDRILNDGDLTFNFTLMPGDTITVPERRF